MADLQNTHTQALKLILSLRTGIERLELSLHNGRAIPLDGQVKDLERQLDQLQRLAQDLESQWRMQGLRDPPARREVWKRKVEAVVDEAASLGLALRRCCEASQARQAEATQRAELFQGASSSGQVLADMDTAARRHLASSKRVLEEAYATGAGVLGSMSSQRETLKTAQRRLLDVINSVGLSDSLLRMADRRHRMDKLLAYGGMAATLLVVVLLYWYLKM